MKRKALILGGNGFIGSNLCKKLLEKGFEVTSFDMALPIKETEGIKYIQGDFFDDDTLKTIIEDADIIYHAISTVNPGNSNRKYIQGYERDFVQTVKLCSMLIGTEKKMIFFSSGGTIYGNQDVQPVTERTVPKPINHYGNIKLCIENSIRTFNIQNGTNILVARISNPYGPGQDYHKGVGMIDAALKHAIEGTPIEVWGDGSIIRDYIYIDDVCEMLYQLALYEGEYSTFNVSYGQGTSINDIIDTVREIKEDVQVNYSEGRTVDAKAIVLDNSRIMSIYNGELVSTKQGIKIYYEYLKGLTS